jgi:hypothetical protein
LVVVAGFLNATTDLETLSIKWSFGKAAADERDDGIVVQSINRQHKNLDSLELPRELVSGLTVSCRVLMVGCYCSFGGADSSDDLDLCRVAARELVVQDRHLLSKRGFRLPPGLESLRLEPTKTWREPPGQHLDFSERLFSACESSLKILDLGMHGLAEGDLQTVAELGLEEIRVRGWTCENLVSLIQVAKPGSKLRIDDTPLHTRGGAWLSENLERGGYSLPELALAMRDAKVGAFDCTFHMVAWDEEDPAPQMQAALDHVCDGLSSTFHVTRKYGYYLNTQVSLVRRM